MWLQKSCGRTGDLQYSLLIHRNNQLYRSGVTSYPGDFVCRTIVIQKIQCNIKPDFIASINVSIIDRKILHHHPSSWCWDEMCWFVCVPKYLIPQGVNCRCWHFINLQIKISSDSACLGFAKHTTSLSNETIKINQIWDRYRNRGIQAGYKVTCEYKKDDFLFRYCRSRRW